MLAAIRSANHYICLETYILRDDATGWEFAAALADRARHGVEVSVMYDGFGSMGLGDSYIDYLRGNGVRLCEYHPVLPWRRGFDLNRRNHRKQLIVDGRLGFVGGINIGDEYRTHGDESAWRDTHMEIAGPAVKRMFRLFMITWLRHGGAPLHRERYVVPSRKAGETPVRILGNRRHRDRGAIQRAYLEAFQAAEEKILITNSYFVPNREIRKALSDAARRGVRVCLLLAGKTDVMLVQLASRSYYEFLLDSGIEVYEWDRTTLHAKTAVVDDDWATVGSYNLNWRSLFHNLECNVIMRDRSVAADLETMFWDDVAQSRLVDTAFLRSLSHPVTLAGELAARLRYWI